MPVSYDKLWKKIKKKGMNKTKLREAISISRSTMAKLGNNEPVALTVLEKVCAELGCDIGDVMEFVESDKVICEEWRRAVSNRKNIDPLGMYL